MTSPFKRTNESELLDNIIKEAKTHVWRKKLLPSFSVGDVIKNVTNPDGKKTRVRLEHKSDHGGRKIWVVEDLKTRKAFGLADGETIELN